jgi:tetrahydromethanopterin S-methyltransferase subunit C
MIPVVMVIIIVGLLISYLGIYFDKISQGHVSGYYSSFSVLSTIFLFTQIIIIFNAIYGKTEDQTQTTKLFSDTTFSLLGLFSVINIMIVLTIGVVLHFYSTQG